MTSCFEVVHIFTKILATPLNLIRNLPCFADSDRETTTAYLPSTHLSFLQLVFDIVRVPVGLGLEDMCPLYHRGYTTSFYDTICSRADKHTIATVYLWPTRWERRLIYEIKDNLIVHSRIASACHCSVIHK